MRSSAQDISHRCFDGLSQELGRMTILALGWPKSLWLSVKGQGHCSMFIPWVKKKNTECFYRMPFFSKHKLGLEDEPVLFGGQM